MRTNKLFIGFILFGLLVNFSSLSAQDAFEKNIEKKFSVKDGYTLDVSSKFSDVEISAWENNEVNIVAEISVEGNNEAKAHELLDKLDVELSQLGNTVYVKTILPEKMNTGKDTKFTIHLVIQAPAYSNLTLEAKYSDVFIEKISGNAMISLAYSNYNIGSLTRGNLAPINEINLAYSSGHMVSADWVKMDMAYSKVNIEELASIALNSKYSEISVEKCNSFIIDSKYDKFQIEDLSSFNGIFKYSSVKLGVLAKKFEIDGAYSNFSIANMGTNFELIKIESRYGNIKINLDKNAAFKIKANAEYGSVSVPGLKIISEKEDGSKKYFEGSYGNNPKSKVEINTKTGNVKFGFN